MVKSYKSEPLVAGQDRPTDQALLEVIQNNVQRVSGNDNISSLTRERPAMGLLASVLSAVGFAGVMLSALVILGLAKLVRSSQDDHY